MNPPISVARVQEPDDLGFRPLRGVLLWRLCDGSSLLEGHIAPCGPWGVEYRLFHDGRFAYSQRFNSREEAIDALATRRADYIGGGWRQVYPQSSH
jgi:hypothetical protein